MPAILRGLIAFCFTAGILSLSTYLVIPNYRILVNISSLGIVLGGTLGVMLMSTPITKILNILRLLSMDTTNSHHHPLYWVRVFEKLSEKGLNPRSASQFKSLSPHPLFRKALAMVEQGFGKEDLRRVLERTSQFSIKEKQESIIFCRSMAKYPPALGMVGTVIGLVGLLFALQGGVGGERIGPGMALALLTTLYGLCIANIIILPMADSLEGQLQNWLSDSEIVIKGFNLVLEDSPTLVVGEELRAFLPSASTVGVQGKAA